MRKRPYWQHDRSLAASQDPQIREAINKGQGRAFDPQNSGGGGRRPLSPEEALNLGFDPEINPDANTTGMLAETDSEVHFRLLAFFYVTAMERPDLSARETEAVALYLWGEELPTVRELWRHNDYDGMLWALLAEHPPWATISGLMRRTKTGSPPTKANIKQYLRRAAEKFGTTIPGLREFAIQGLVKTRNRLALQQARSRPGGPALALLAGGQKEVELSRALTEQRKARSEGGTSAR